MIVAMGLVFVTVPAPRVSAQILVDAVSEVTTFFFTTYYSLGLTQDDCIEVLLLQGVILADRFDVGCGSAGAFAFGFLFADVAPGGYTFEVRSTSTTDVLFSRSWILPALTMTVDLSASTADTGDLVGVTATFGMAFDGPDAYLRRGTLTVDAGEPFSTSVAIEILSPVYLAFFGLEPVSDFETYAATVPLAFGTAGTKSVGVTFDDTVHALSRTTRLVVSDPNEGEIAALEDEIAELRDELNRSKSRVTTLEASASALGSLLSIAALVLGALAVVVAVLALRATRRVRPPIPPEPRAPTPAAVWSMAPPSAPPAPPEGPPPPPAEPPAYDEGAGPRTEPADEL
ncbi:MAG: hypothetical protein ACT4OI_02165 [Methanobacteriota archaeon]